MFRVLLIAASLIAPLHAQIYADFTVSSGGNPLGTFRVLLEHEKAPRTCANFIGLASGRRPWVDLTSGAVRTNRPYYNGLTFHRLIPSFVIQGGSPNGLGTDGPGYSILDEYDSSLRHNSQYVLSMAKASAPNTGGSQFFITLRATPELNDKHSVFGKVISGTSIIDGFKNATNYPTGASEKPITPIVMDSVVISGSSYAGFDLNNPAFLLPKLGGTPTSVSRNALNSTFTTAFSPAPKTEYMLFESFDMQTWSSPMYRLNGTSTSQFSIVSDEISAPRFFTNLATVNYDAVPDPLQATSIQGRTLRMTFGPGSHIDFIFTGSQSGTWFDSGSQTGGTLSSLAWQGGIRTTGENANLVSDAKFLSLVAFSTVLDDYFEPGLDGQVGAWLSFHSNTGGWMEEFNGDDAFRVPFEILSN
jgi:peptidyl-prolyl cis-trans isomerase A (cyclophilin A)